VELRHSVLAVQRHDVVGFVRRVERVRERRFRRRDT
jgi:hypothetical protein